MYARNGTLLTRTYSFFMLMYTCHLNTKKQAFSSLLLTINSKLTSGRILGRNWDKGLQSFSSLLFTVTSTGTSYSTPPPPRKRCLKLVWKPQV
jgi:hypothetical protein